jgi:hypothetical protein
MSPTDARFVEIANEQHPAGGALVRVALDESEHSDVRIAALDAYAALTSASIAKGFPLPQVPVPPGMAGAAAAVAEMLTTIVYDARPLERQRAVKALSALCTEAGAIVRERAA